VPPLSVGRVTDQRPNVWGANMDNSDLVAGTTLYLPSSFPARCCRSRRARRARPWRGCRVRDRDVPQGRDPGRPAQGKTIKLPRAETPTELHDDGFNEDLDEAVKTATREMLDWIVELKGLPRDEAYLLASVAMDLRRDAGRRRRERDSCRDPKSIFSR